MGRVWTREETDHPDPLASLLRRYKIKPGTIRIGPGEKDTAKGYALSQFAETLERYLPRPKRAVTPSQINDFNGFNGNQPVTSPTVVTDENSKNASAINARDGVTGSVPELWEAEIEGRHPVCNQEPRPPLPHQHRTPLACQHHLAEVARSARRPATTDQTDVTCGHPRGAMRYIWRAVASGRSSAPVLALAPT